MDEFLKKIGVSNDILEALKGEDADLTKLAENYRASFKDVLINDGEFIDPIKKSVQEQTFAGTSKKFKKKLVKGFGLELTDAQVDEIELDDILKTIQENSKSKTTANINEYKDQITELTNKLNEERNNFDSKLEQVNAEWSSKYKNEKISEAVKTYIAKQELTAPFDFAYSGVMSQLQSRYKLDLNEDSLVITDQDGSQVLNDEKTAKLGAFEVIDKFIEPIRKKSNGTGGAPPIKGVAPKIVNGEVGSVTKKMAEKMGIAV